MDWSEVEFSTSDVIPDNDVNGLEFIRNFVENQRLNDYFNVAVDKHENEQNQENVNSNSRYVKKCISDQIYNK